MRNQIRRTDVSGVFGVSAALLRSHRIGCSSFTRFVANRNELSAFRFSPSSLFPLPSSLCLQSPATFDWVSSTSLSRYWDLLRRAAELL